MRNLLRAVLCAAFVLGMATPSEAIICCLVNKIVECPPIRKARNECRAKKAAKKMQVKQPLCDRLKGLLECGCDCDCECASECNCN